MRRFRGGREGAPRSPQEVLHDSIEKGLPIFAHPTGAICPPGWYTSAFPTPQNRRVAPRLQVAKLGDVVFVHITE